MRRGVLVVLVGIGVVFGVLWFLGFRFNLTASLPLGIYRESSDAPHRGSVVHVCLPRQVAQFARQRGYLGNGRCPAGVRPLGKVVLAVEGDVVTLEREAIRVNGAVVPNSMTVSEDSRGRAIPHYTWGEHRIEPGELWLFSPYHRNAYDSRYYGPVQASQIVSVLEPILTQQLVRAPNGIRSADCAGCSITAEPCHSTNGSKARC